MTTDTQERIDEARRAVSPLIAELVNAIEARNLDSRAELTERLIHVYARQADKIRRQDDVIGRLALALNRSRSKGGDVDQDKAA
jgi:hypothetical protein